MQNLSIILPVYNEKDTIENVLKEWSTVLKKDKVNYNFIICEDGSTDGTKELLKKLKTQYPLTLNKKNERRGYGQAVIDGIKSADATYLLCIDSDGQCDPKDFKKFWEAKNDKGVIIGWRVNRADNTQRKLFSVLFKGAFVLLFPTKIHDPSAPFVLFKKSLISPYIKDLTYLQEGFWWGFVGMCVKKKIPLEELIIHHRQRAHGDTQVYHLKKIPIIASRNFLGLIKLRLH